MMGSIRYMKILLFLMSSSLSIMLLFSGCLSKSEKDTAQSPDYADKIEIKVILEPSSNLEDLQRDDIIYTVKNKGDKTITEILGEVVFYNRDGTEVGKMPWMFITVDREWEDLAGESRKGAFRPLPPGITMSAGYIYLGFFVGRKELRNKLKANWDNLTAKPIIKKVIVE